MRQQYRMPGWATQAARRLGTIMVFSTSAVVIVVLALLLTHSGGGASANLKAISDICPSLSGLCP